MMLSSVLALQGAPAACAAPPRQVAHVNQGAAATIVAPGRRWRIDVTPVVPVARTLRIDANVTPVLLSTCRDSGQKLLFTLERDATLVWGPGSTSVLAIDAPSPARMRLRYFPFAQTPDNGLWPGPELDRAVFRAVMRRLLPPREAQFYETRFVSWRPRRLVLAIGGMTTNGATGPFTPYCFGVVADPDTARVLAVLDADRLAAVEHTSCLEFP